ncbi:MAG: acyl carrier protein [Chloroflexota bacterium]
MIRDEIKQQIRDFLSEHIRQVTLHDDQDIFASGFVNSMFAMELVLFIESHLQVQLSNADLRLDNFRTINSMANLIQEKSDKKQ